MHRGLGWEERQQRLNLSHAVPTGFPLRNTAVAAGPCGHSGQVPSFPSLTKAQRPSSSTALPVRKPAQMIALEEVTRCGGGATVQMCNRNLKIGKNTI